MNTLMTSSGQWCEGPADVPVHKLRHIIHSGVTWCRTWVTLSDLGRKESKHLMRSGVTTPVAVYNTQGSPFLSNIHPSIELTVKHIVKSTNYKFTLCQDTGDKKKTTTKTTTKSMDTVLKMAFLTTYILHWSSTLEKSKRNLPYLLLFALPTHKFLFYRVSLLSWKTHAYPARNRYKGSLSKTKHQQYLSKGIGTLDRLMNHARNWETGLGTEVWSPATNLIHDIR